MKLKLSKKGIIILLILLILGIFFISKYSKKKSPTINNDSEIKNVYVLKEDNMFYPLNAQVNFDDQHHLIYYKKDDSELSFTYNYNDNNQITQINNGIYKVYIAYENDKISQITYTMNDKNYFALNYSYNEANKISSIDKINYADNTQEKTEFAYFTINDIAYVYENYSHYDSKNNKYHNNIRVYKEENILEIQKSFNIINYIPMEIVSYQMPSVYNVISTYSSSLFSPANSLITIKNVPLYIRDNDVLYQDFDKNDRILDENIYNTNNELVSSKLYKYEEIDENSFYGSILNDIGNNYNDNERYYLSKYKYYLEKGILTKIEVISEENITKEEYNNQKEDFINYVNNNTYESSNNILKIIQEQIKKTNNNSTNEENITDNTVSSNSEENVEDENYNYSNTNENNTIQEEEKAPNVNIIAYNTYNDHTSITIFGKGKGPFKLLLNGIEKEVSNDENSFTKVLDVNLMLDENIFNIEVTDASGLTTYKTVTITKYKEFTDKIEEAKVE